MVFIIAVEIVVLLLFCFVVLLFAAPTTSVSFGVTIFNNRCDFQSFSFLFDLEREKVGKHRQQKLTNRVNLELASKHIHTLQALALVESSKSRTNQGFNSGLNAGKHMQKYHIHHSHNSCSKTAQSATPHTRGS